MEEVWKEVPSVPQIMASTLGRIMVKPMVGITPSGGIRSYSCKPTFGMEDTSATGRQDSPKRRIIRIGRFRKNFKIHRLVCEAFHGAAPFESAIVLHLDEDPSNNQPGNLRWGTRKENQNFPKAVAAFKARTGENSPWAIHQQRASA